MRPSETRDNSVKWVRTDKYYVDKYDIATLKGAVPVQSTRGQQEAR